MIFNLLLNAGDIRPLLANRRNTAKNDIVDIAGVQLIAVANDLQGLCGERKRGDLMERSAGSALAARCAHVIVNIAFSHRSFSLLAK